MPPVTLQFLEMKMAEHKHQVALYDKKPKEQTAFFFSELFESVIQAFKSQAESWLQKYGGVVR